MVSKADKTMEKGLVALASKHEGSKLHASGISRE
jgi:hypothetical protein